MTTNYKKYIVFVCHTYYPGGGIDDIYASFDDLAKAKTIEKEEHNKPYRWAYTIDRDTWKVIEETPL